MGIFIQFISSYNYIDIYINIFSFCYFFIICLYPLTNIIYKQINMELNDQEFESEFNDDEEKYSENQLND
jgi:hypothetical protein